MKTLRYTMTVFVGLAAAAAVSAATPQTSSRAEVTFSDPDKFTDASEGPRGSDIRRDVVLDEIKSYIQDRANRFVPEGQKLSVTITDIDLAGEVEPWRTRSQDVRIVKEIYMPRIDLNFKLTDSSGAVIKEGQRHLSDMNFMQKLNPIDRNDPRVHEKALIDDWLRREFGKAKK